MTAPAVLDRCGATDLTTTPFTGAEAPKLLRIRHSEIDEASLTGSIARVTVRIEADLGEGDLQRKSEEYWTFMRDTQSDDPNWLLDDVDVGT